MGNDFVLRESDFKQYERNLRVVKRIVRRRPKLREHYKKLIDKGIAEHTMLEAATPTEHARERVLEAIVSQERPVLFVQDGRFNTEEVTIRGEEARLLVDRMKATATGEKLLPVLPLVGRFDVKNFGANTYFLGTGWFVDKEIVVTNRHVAALVAANEAGRFVFRRGIAGKPIEASLCNAHEYDDLAPDASRIFAVKEVLYIEPDGWPNDIAFVRVVRQAATNVPPFIEIADTDVSDDAPVCVIGYPAKAPPSVIADQGLMKELYRDRFDVKRAAPGYSMGTQQGLSEHDCTTLGGNSGSVVMDFDGKAVGLHFAGRSNEANYAVTASVLKQYVRQKRWNQPIVLDSSRGAPGGGDVGGRVRTKFPSGATPHSAGPLAVPSPPPPAPPPPPPPPPVAHGSGGGNIGGPATLTVVPFKITIEVGGSCEGGGAGAITVGPAAPASHAPASPPVPASPPAPPAGDKPKVDPAQVEAAVAAFWDARPPSVIAARVGFDAAGDRIGDAPFIAASVTPTSWTTMEAGEPREFMGVPVRYFPAEVSEQIESVVRPLESTEVAYDDDNRKATQFSFDELDDSMDVTLCVGPEYSWDVLKGFLNDSNEPASSKKGQTISAMYEFHALHIKNAVERRLEEGGSLTLVLDNATFSGKEISNSEFDREETFEEWEQHFGKRFRRIVAPEGISGLISDSYHIKVTVRDDDTFWLSSGNWKPASSQPIVTQAQRDNAADEDIKGNREWHVVVRHPKLAGCFRSHIAQDFKRSKELGAGELPPSRLREEETFVDVALETPLVLERRAPGRVVDPVTFSRRFKVKPLLTPDDKGAVYSDAVLELIESATQSLLFQIPYIGMPPNPRSRRGYIDKLIAALTKKLKTLDDARVLLRSGSSKFSSPTHAAWYFKSKGVDVDQRVCQIEDSHTKGMIVDGRRVLIGSHNWSQPGVSLNRDASLIFDDQEVARYFTQAFEIDWARATRIKPKQFIKPEAVILEAVGDAPPPGFKRVPLSELLKDD